MNELPIFDICMGLFGGLALFLLGMEQMTDALKSVAGAGMSKVLGKLTRNRFMSAISGALVTAVIQSSSVTTVLVIGFISAGLMSLQQSVGVIMGANIGSTATAQIIAFKVTHYALLLVAVGFGTTLLAKRKSWRVYGRMVLGLGMIFLGMGIMSDATTSLRTYDPFIQLMQNMDNPLLAILVAALFTALVQSSAATTGIVIVLASQGFITLEAGIALAFGANIGTCVTAILAALGKPRAAAQAAAVHLLFNVLGVLIWLPFIGLLAGIVQSISPMHPELEGAARLAAETPRQIANAHTLFNIANTFIFIWFTAPLAALVMRLIPEKPEAAADAVKPRYLDDASLEAPALALDRIRLEATHLGELTVGLIDLARPAVIAGSGEDLDAVVARETDLHALHHAITDYGRRLTSDALSSVDSRRLEALNRITGNIQHIAETITLDFVALGRERLEKELVFSEETLAELETLGAVVKEGFDLALQALAESDPAPARRILELKPRVQETADALLDHLGRRLTSEDPNRAVLYRIESRAAELMQRIYYFSKKIGKVLLAEAEGEAADPEAERT